MPLKIIDLSKIVINTMVKEKAAREKLKPSVGKLMKYKCPLCRYERASPANQMAGVRNHLRIHFKAFVCGICNAR